MHGLLNVKLMPTVNKSEAREALTLIC